MTAPTPPSSTSTGAPGAPPSTPVLRPGARGEPVRRLQLALRERGLHDGAVDGIYGEGTRKAVVAFQRSAGLHADGIVGDATWRALLGLAAGGADDLAQEPLVARCLALTASFETGAAVHDCWGVSAGDFDGQGMSLGALQWNLGQGTLQALLRDLDSTTPECLDEVCGPHAADLREMLALSRKAQVAWARERQHPVKHRLHDPWRELFRALGRRPEMQAAQIRAAHGMFAEATEWCVEFGVVSERAAALMFDIRVQNGSIARGTADRIREEYDALDVRGLEGEALEVARLELIANRRAEAAKKQWVEDVRTRKLTIARGEGRVHGRRYDLARDYGITLRPVGQE